MRQPGVNALLAAQNARSKAECGHRAYFGECPLLRDEPLFPPSASPNSQNAFVRSLDLAYRDS